MTCGDRGIGGDQSFTRCAAKSRVRREETTNESSYASTSALPNEPRMACVVFSYSSRLRAARKHGTL